MVEQVADEYVAEAQRLLDLNVKDWQDEEWQQWQQLINIFRRIKSETINNIKPYQKLMFDSMNRYFAVNIPFEERQHFETEPHKFEPGNFQLCTDKHTTLIEPAVMQLMTYQGEVNKHLHRLFPIIRLHQKGIQGLLDRLFELSEANEKLEQKNDDLRSELEGEKKIPLQAVVRQDEEELPEFEVPPKRKKKEKKTKEEDVNNY